MDNVIVVDDLATRKLTAMPRNTSMVKYQPLRKVVNWERETTRTTIITTATKTLVATTTRNIFKGPVIIVENSVTRKWIVT